MQLARFDEVPVHGMPTKGFRGDDITFRDLLQGVQGTPANYSLQWVEVANGYHTPRHRHNFEQVRIMIEGSFGFGPEKMQLPGSCSYFCEGTYYTQMAEGRSVTLLLQIGGPTGQGFMNRKQLHAAVAELKSKGEFHDGVFTWYDANGKKHNQDSYEAAWEHVHGREVVYPKPQYDAPITMRPEYFPWIEQEGAPGVATRNMGRFNSHGLEIGQLRVAAGALARVDTAPQPRLVFCIDGAGTANGLSYAKWTSLECVRGEAVTIAAARESTFWTLGVPVFDARPAARPVAELTSSSAS